MMIYGQLKVNESHKDPRGPAGLAVRQLRDEFLDMALE
jgi:hypothetical protein